MMTSSSDIMMPTSLGCMPSPPPNLKGEWWGISSNARSMGVLKNTLQRVENVPRCPEITKCASIVQRTLNVHMRWKTGFCSLLHLSMKCLVPGVFADYAVFKALRHIQARAGVSQPHPCPTGNTDFLVIGYKSFFDAEKDSNGRYEVQASDTEVWKRVGIGANWLHPRLGAEKTSNQRSEEHTGVGAQRKQHKCSCTIPKGHKMSPKSTRPWTYLFSGYISATTHRTMLTLLFKDPPTICHVMAAAKPLESPYPTQARPGKSQQRPPCLPHVCWELTSAQKPNHKN